MATVSLANRVKVNTTTVGTGTVTLGTVFANNYCTFAEAGITDGQTVRYEINEGTDFEIGTGVYTAAGTTMTRASVTISKIAGVQGTTKMTLAGAATVSIVAVKEDFYYQGGPTVAIADGGTAGTSATAGFNNLSPVTTRGDIITRDATNNVRLAVGAAGTVLKSNGTDPSWGNVNAANLTTTIPPSGLAPAINLGLAASAAASALTIAIKGADGNDPSATNPVLIPFRNVTQATGTPSWLSITAAASLVIPSGSTLDAINATAFRLWVVGFNDGGTFRLGVMNCSVCTTAAAQIFPLAEWGVASSIADATVTVTIATPGVVSWTGHGLNAGDRVVFSTTGALPTGITAGTTYFVISTGLTANSFQIAATFGGAAIATSGSQSGTHSGHPGAGRLNTAVAVSSKAYRILGFIEWSASGLVATGTWTTTNLNRIQLFGPGVHLPGQMIQNLTSVVVTGDTTTSATFVASSLSPTITPTSAANIIRGLCSHNIRSSSANVSTNVQWSRGNTSNTNLIGSWSFVLCGSTIRPTITAVFDDLPNTTSAQIYNVQYCSGTAGQTVILGDNGSGYISLMEIMA